MAQWQGWRAAWVDPDEVACVALVERGDGRKPRATGPTRAELLKDGEANGYPNELWTLQRVAEVIERMTGVAYHPARVWHLLRESLGWSWQRPARRDRTRRCSHPTLGLTIVHSASGRAGGNAPAWWRVCHL
jgi:hypothetical protein